MIGLVRGLNYQMLSILVDGFLPPMCHGQGCRVFLGMGDLPPLMTESLFHGYINPYYKVDDHPLLYGNNGGL